jgi:hypothetical protein
MHTDTSREQFLLLVPYLLSSVVPLARAFGLHLREKRPKMVRVVRVVIPIHVDRSPGISSGPSPFVYV